MFVRPGPVQPVLEPYEKLFQLSLSLLCANYDRLIVELDRLVVSLGRYGNQSMDDVERWPRKKLMRRARILSDLIGEENKKGAPYGPSGSPM